MKAVIPHHSITMLTSDRTEVSEPKVQKLAEETIQTQGKEIAEMKRLIADLEAKSLQTLASRHAVV